MTKKDKKVMKDALVAIRILIDNPTFVAHVAKTGYQLDAKSLFDAFYEAAGWKSKTPLVTKKKV